MPFSLLALTFGPTTLVTLLIALIVIAVVIALVGYVVNQMAPPDFIRWTVWGIVLVLIIVAALRFFGIA